VADVPQAVATAVKLTAVSVSGQGGAQGSAAHWAHGGAATLAPHANASDDAHAAAHSDAGTAAPSSWLILSDLERRQSQTMVATSANAAERRTATPS
jgi:hypothetical protein